MRPSRRARSSAFVEDLARKSGGILISTSTARSSRSQYRPIAPRIRRTRLSLVVLEQRLTAAEVRSVLADALRCRRGPQSFRGRFDAEQLERGLGFLGVFRMQDDPAGDVVGEVRFDQVGDPLGEQDRERLEGTGQPTRSISSAPAPRNTQASSSMSTPRRPRRASADPKTIMRISAAETRCVRPRVLWSTPMGGSSRLALPTLM